MPIDTVTFQTTALATPPSGQKIAVNNLPSGAGAAQYIKLMDGTPDTEIPISGDANGLNISTKGAYTLPVSGAFFQATQPVSGTFWPPTQPVSGTVAVSNFPATQPVSGSVTVSGSVSVSNFPATQPVSIAVPVVLGAAPGTAIGTVAVSGTVTLGAAAATTIGTVNIAAGQNVGITGSVGVTGAFYQVTQPVSVAAVVHVDDNGGSLTVDAPAGTPLYVRPIPGASNGWNYYANPALTNVKQQLTLAGCTIGGYVIHNPNAVTAYVLVWDIAVTGVTVGSTTPSWVIGIPAGATANVEWTLGVQHAVALTLAAAPAVAGTGTLTTGLPMMMLFR